MTNTVNKKAVYNLCFMKLLTVNTLSFLKSHLPDNSPFFLLPLDDYTAVKTNFILPFTVAHGQLCVVF